MVSAKHLFCFSNGGDIISLSRSGDFDLIGGQRTASCSLHVTIQKNSDDFLFVLENQSIGNVDDNDFSAI